MNYKKYLKYKQDLLDLLHKKLKSMGYMNFYRASGVSDCTVARIKNMDDRVTYKSMLQILKNMENGYKNNLCKRRQPIKRIYKLRNNLLDQS